MKKLMLCVCVYLLTAAVSKPVLADETMFSFSVSPAQVDNYIARTYRKIDFSRCSTTLSFDVFYKAMYGYMNLRNAGKLNTSNEVITICDLSRSSNDNRMWVINLNTKKVLFNTYVAHGQGSGDEYATSFSNKNNTHKSSMGFYVTGETYDGDHGLSLHLEGVDHGYNDAAFDRGIVVHGADYVSQQYAQSNNCLGRSWGCPAVPAKLSTPIINTIKNGTCLFIFYPEKKYLQTAYWLNNKVAHLPEDGMVPEFARQQVRDTVIQYVSAKGKIDSVKKIASLH